MKNIILLGSTGSIGRNVLDVVGRYPEKFRIKAISGNENIALLAKQAKKFRPETVAISDESRLPELKRLLPKGIKAESGIKSIERLASSKADIIFLAISGSAALSPLIAALEAGRTVALASKEPVVSAGKILSGIMKKTGARIIPVDSEHSAVMQCLAGRTAKDVRTLYITGSGGALRNRDKKDFKSLTVKEVLNHPKWNMGDKITVDSATLMNKGLEVIEARWLFDIPAEKIKVVIHPEVIIHALAEFVDGTMSAGLFMPDMRLPILRALSFPDILESDLPRVDLGVLKNLTFEAPDTKKFPALDLAYEALRRGETAPAVLTASNEAAVKLFLAGKIRFTDITRIVSKVLRGHKCVPGANIEDIKKAEKAAITEVLKKC